MNRRALLLPSLLCCVFGRDAMAQTPVSATSKPAPLPDPVALPSKPATWASGAQTVAAGERLALLIAVDSYERHADWQLPGAAQSADKIRQALLEHAGFAAPAVTTLRGRDVHLDAVRSAVLAAGEKVAAGGSGVFYVHWLGHGWVQDGEQRLFGYYTDELAGSFAPAIGRRELLAWIEQAVARAKARGATLTPVLVVDACRVARGAPPPKAKLVAATAFELYGAKDGEMVAAGQGGEGFAFTAALGAAMAALAPRGEVALDLVFREARDRTLRGSAQKQEPVWLAPAQAVAPKFLQPARASFAVRLVDALSGARVEAAKLLVDDAAQQLGDASAVLRLLPGDHVIAVQAPGYLARTENLALSAAQNNAELTIPLLPDVVVVRGRLVPPGALAVRGRAKQTARADYHVLQATADGEGRFELRLPSLQDASVEVVQQGRALQSVRLPALANALLRDKAGVHDCVPVLDLVISLEGEALAALQIAPDVKLNDAQAPPQEPQFNSDVDRADWQRAKAAMARGRFDQARDALMALQGGPELKPWRRYVDQRWAREVLERALREGPTTGEWEGVDAVGGYLLAALFADKSEYPLALRQLYDRVRDEQISVRSRAEWNSANAALAEGNLEQALQHYDAALRGATPHYEARIAQQVAQIRGRLYARLMSAGAEREVAGDVRGALSAYASSLRYSMRGRVAAKRLAQSPRLAPAPQVTALIELIDQSYHGDAPEGDRPLLDDATWDTLELAGLASLPLVDEATKNSTSIYDSLRVRGTRELRADFVEHLKQAAQTQTGLLEAMRALRTALGGRDLAAAQRAHADCAARVTAATVALEPILESAESFHVHHDADAEGQANESVRQVAMAAAKRLRETSDATVQALRDAEAKARETVGAVVLASDGKPAKVPAAAEFDAAERALSAAVAAAGALVTRLSQR